MNEKKLMKDINKWRNKLSEASERLGLAKAKYINYMGNQCPYKVEPAQTSEGKKFEKAIEELMEWLPFMTPIPDIFEEAFNE